MRFILGLLFLAWGSSFIFNFDFNFGKYIFPAFLIGLGINIIFDKNDKCKKSEKFSNKCNKQAKKDFKESEPENKKGDDINE